MGQARPSHRRSSAAPSRAGRLRQLVGRISQREQRALSAVPERQSFENLNSSSSVALFGATDGGASLAALRQDHQPANSTEDILVECMAQHHWLSQRAIHLLTALLSDDGLIQQNEKSFSLYLRYRIANERAFSKCLHDLLKLRSARRLADNDARKAETERRKQEQREGEDKRKQKAAKFDEFVAGLEAERLRDMAIVKRMRNQPLTDRFSRNSDPAADRLASNRNR